MELKCPHCQQKLEAEIILTEKNGVQPEDINKLTIKEQTEMFTKIWVRYPRREGKVQAYKHFCKNIKTKEDWERIKLALANYKKHLEDKNVEEKYIKLGSTWFYQWEDWVQEPTARNQYS